MNIIAIATDVQDEDTPLIQSMLTKFLPVKSENISVLDSRSYRPVLSGQVGCVITYGKQACLALKANNGEVDIPHLNLPDIQNIRRRPENKENIRQVVDVLRKFDVVDPIEDLVTLTLKYEDGDIVVGEEGDVLPDEMKQLVALLGKLDAEEVEIVFRRRASNSGD